MKMKMKLLLMTLTIVSVAGAAGPAKHSCCPRGGEKSVSKERLAPFVKFEPLAPFQVEGMVKKALGISNLNLVSDRCGHHQWGEDWRDWKKRNPGAKSKYEDVRDSNKVNSGEKIVIRLGFNFDDPEPEPGPGGCGCPLEIALAEGGCGWIHATIWGVKSR